MTTKKHYTNDSHPHYGITFLVLSVVLLLNSCAPLTKSQARMTGNYFGVMTNYPDFYRELNNRTASIKLSSNKLESALTDNDSLKVEKLIGAIKLYEQELQIPDSIVKHLRYIDDYTQKYFVLVPKGFDVYRIIKGTSVTLSSLVGLGDLAKNSLPEASIKLSKTKARKIKNHFMTSSDSLHYHMRSLQDYVNDLYLVEIQKVDEQSLIQLKNLLHQIQANRDPFDYYSNYNQVISNFYQRVFLTKKYATYLSTSIDYLLAAEQEIQQKTSERNKITSQSENLAEFVRITNRMRSVNQKIAQNEQN